MICSGTARGCSGQAKVTNSDLSAEHHFSAVPADETFCRSYFRARLPMGFATFVVFSTSRYSGISPCLLYNYKEVSGVKG
jgi:hypothetical protein